MPYYGDIGSAHPSTRSIRRLTRNEYHNAIGDLLAISVDVSALLPKDKSSQGFGNIAAGSLSATLMSRDVSAAEKIAAAVVGTYGEQAGVTIRIRLISKR